MEKDIKYNKIVAILNEFLQNSSQEWFFRQFSNLTEFCELILEALNNKNIENVKYSYMVDINDSLKEAISFFESIDPKYAYLFQNILQEKNQDKNGNVISSIKFYKTDNNGLNRNSNISKGMALVEYSNNLGDLFEIIHESTHKFSSSSGEDGTLKKMLGEVPTITMELLLADYLLKGGKFSRDEIMKYKLHRFSSCYNDACVILFEGLLFEVYSKYGNVTEDLLKQELNLLTNKNEIYNVIEEKLDDYIDDVIKDKRLSSIYRQRYVYGLVLGSQIHQKVLEKRENIQILNGWIHLLGNGFNISNNLYEFPKQNVNQLRDSLKSEVVDIMDYTAKKI